MKHLTLTASLLLSLCLPLAAQDTPKPDAPKPDAPKPDAPKPDAPKPDAPKPDAPKPGKKGDADGDGKLSKEERRAKRKAEREARLKQKNPNDPRLRDLAPDSPEGKALDDLLAVAPNYAKDGTVLLTYTFKQAEQIGDWSTKGFDMAEGVLGKGRGRRKRRAAKNGKQNRLALGVNSRGKGVLLHKLHLTEEYTITFNLAIDRTSSRSDLVVFAGKGGVRWASQLVKRSGTRFSKLAGKVNKDAFVRGRAVVIKIQVKDNVMTAFVNGTRIGETKKLKNKLDGQVGIYATDMLLFVNSIEIKGKVEKSKL